jgi:tetratricopeptide (TPR) repeat protein
MSLPDGLALRSAAEQEFNLHNTIGLRSREKHMKKQEDEEAEAFRALAEKYNVPVGTYDPENPIYVILNKIDAADRLSDYELRCLSESGAPDLANNIDMIQVKEVEYELTENPQILARVSRLWREVGNPERAQEAVRRVLDSNFRPVVHMSAYDESMLLTTCGGSLRDLKRTADARICANRAIALRKERPDAYAYCLLGGVEADAGNYDSAEANFEICAALDPRMNTDNWRKGALKHMKLPSEYAAYLLRKDPEKFGWARGYLRQQAQRLSYRTSFPADEQPF